MLTARPSISEEKNCYTCTETDGLLKVQVHLVGKIGIAVLRKTHGFSQSKYLLQLHNCHSPIFQQLIHLLLMPLHLPARHCHTTNDIYVDVSTTQICISS